MRYWALHTFGFVLEGMGVATWVGTIILAVYIAVYGPGLVVAPITELGALIGINDLNPMLNTFLAWGIVGLLIRGAIAGLSLLASGQLLLLILDAADNLRFLRLFRERRILAEMEAKRPPSMMNMP